MKRLCTAFVFLFSFFFCIGSSVGQPVDPESRLLLPFSVGSPGLDTGIAISNPSASAGPFTLRLSRTLANGAVQNFQLQSSNLAASGVGQGLNAAGELEAGGNYTVLASQLAQAAGLAEFTGQLGIEASFAQAQAVNFIFNPAFTTAHGYSARDLDAGLPLLPPDNLPSLVWPVKYTCGFLPEFRLGFWFTDIDVLNPSDIGVELSWEARNEAGVVSSGTVGLAANGVLDIPCFEPPFNLRGKGFLKLTARRTGRQRLLQVVAIYKNLEFSELETQKGYRVPPVRLPQTSVYGSEFLCGDAPSGHPSSFADIFELVDPADLPRLWRPGTIGTNVLLHNPFAEPVLISYRIADTQGDVVVSGQRELLNPGQVRRFDCSLLENRSFFGFLTVEGPAAVDLIMTFDKTDYSSLIDGSLHVEYVRPIRGFLSSQ